MWITPFKHFLCIYLLIILVVLVVGAVDMLITTLSPYYIRLSTVDKLGDNYVDNLCIKCGKLFIIFYEKSYQHDINNLST
jgi:hypothetical protein